MPDLSGLGVLYTDHADLSRGTPVASLWSYQSHARERHRRPVAVNADGNHEYWLDRSDPLLNTAPTTPDLAVDVHSAENVFQSAAVSDGQTVAMIVQRALHLRSLGQFAGPRFASPPGTARMRAEE